MSEPHQHNSLFTSGQCVVISGGGKGLGRAAVEACLARGMHVAVIDQDAAAIARLTEHHAAEDIIAFHGDVSDAAQLATFCQHVVSRWQQVTLLINNAAIMQPTRFEGPVSDWKRMFDINVWSTLQLTQLLLPHMRHGAIVNVGSKEGITTPPGNPAYSASKAALKVMTEQLAHELRTSGRSVSAHLLVPGFTHTPMNFPDGETSSSRAKAAWHPEQVIDCMISGIEQGDFYLWCLDNETSLAADHAKIVWHYQDILKNRPALSRWHPDYTEQFQQFLTQQTSAT